jgi:hypothetical protein
VIVILASQYDISARQLAERWTAYGACLLTSEDISTPGWRYYLANPSVSTAVVNGRRITVGEIDGVVTRLPWVTEADLPHIVPVDSAYVAAEMSAFLIFWLSELTCPILNRPTAGSLNGPSWRREQWVANAARAGLRIRSENRHLSLTSAATPQERQVKSTVIVVGDRCLGRVDSSLLERSRCLAEIANVDFLGIQFSSPDPDAAFVSATVYPEIDSVEVSDAMLQYFERA